MRNPEATNPRQQSVYIPIKLWEAVAVRAKTLGAKSRSAYLVRLILDDLAKEESEKYTTVPLTPEVLS